MTSDAIRYKLDGIRDIEYKIKSLKSDLALLKNASNLECTYSANGQKVRIAFISNSVNGAKLKDVISAQLWQDIKDLERSLSEEKASLLVSVENFTKE